MPGGVPQEASATRAAKLEAVRGHRLLWDRDPQSDTWAVRESLQHSKSKPRVACVKEMLRALGAVEGRMPRALAASVEELVLHLLWVDLEACTIIDDRNADPVVKNITIAG